MTSLRHWLDISAVLGEAGAGSQEGGSARPAEGTPAGEPLLLRGEDGGGLLLDHVAVVVRDLSAAAARYRLLGFGVGPVETVADEGVRVAMIALGESRIELLEPIAAATSLARFLDRRGEGLHHIAVRCDDVRAVFERMRREGVRLVSDRVRVGAGGHGYFFVHPEASGGVLLEYVGELADESER